MHVGQLSEHATATPTQRTRALPPLLPLQAPPSAFRKARASTPPQKTPFREAFTQTSKLTYNCGENSTLSRFPFSRPLRVGVARGGVSSTPLAIVIIIIIIIIVVVLVQGKSRLTFLSPKFDLNFSHFSPFSSVFVAALPYTSPWGGGRGRERLGGR